MEFADKILRLEIVAAEPERILTQLTVADVALLDVIQIDFLTVGIGIKKQHEGLVRKIVEKNGGSCRITGRSGLFVMIHRLWRRPVLITGVLLFTLASCIINSRIFFVNVAGNKALPDKLILAEAEKCGITFGTKASKVRSEEVKNQLLKQLPRLQWIGVNTCGTVATIQVRERSAQDSLDTPQPAVSHIVAINDGVVSKMIVYKGNPLIQPGQSVQAGDLLVSGYTDCGIVQLGERADAEVYAHTLRSVHVVSPVPAGRRGECIAEHTCHLLRIGKKVINFCNHSGISDVTCVKMYEEEYCTLPGGFRLPISLVKVKTRAYQMTEVDYDPKAFRDWLPQFARSYVSEQMIAGSILNEQWQWTVDKRLCTLNGSLSCHEMIGQEKYEEIIEQDAEDN